MAELNGSFLDDERDDLSEDEDEDDVSLIDEADRRESTDSNRRWDQFKDEAQKQQSESMASNFLIDLSVEILKIVAYIGTFLIVLFGAFLAKTSLLLMTGQLRNMTAPTNICIDDKLDTQGIFTMPELEKIKFIWGLLIIYAVPELGSWIRSARICFFKSFVKPETLQFFTVALLESLHVIGLAIFVFEVLPQLDAVRGLMLTNCISIVPAIMKMMSRSSKENKSMLATGFDIAAVLFQLTGFFLWPAIDNHNPRLWWTPLALFLMSFGWWMNYVPQFSGKRDKSGKSSKSVVVNYMYKLKETMKSSNTLYYTYLFVSVWKVILFFCSTLIILEAQGTSVIDFFGNTTAALNESHPISVTRVIRMPNDPNTAYLVDQTIEMTTSYFGVWCAVLTNILGAYMCYIFSKFACRILIQKFSMALPSILVTAVTALFLITVTNQKQVKPCYYTSIFGPYLFFNVPSTYDVTFISEKHAWVWILWLLSEIWVTMHIWVPKVIRLAKTEELFAAPMYSPILVEQSICLNRREDEVDQDSIVREDETVAFDEVPHLYACATMWHENKDEMLEMLKSIFSMDLDQCCRRVAMETLNNNKPDKNYYTFETHIFFDDAFELDENENSVANSFVKLLVASMNEAARAVQNNDIRVKAPSKYPTPYGGRLVYTLPGKTKMIVHLKDKAKIRHRKRWSQCMYMYYLLGYKLMDTDMDQGRKVTKGENTFLLALDGDIDFRPRAVHLLVDRMKKDKKLGAACGRIHPVGSGLMAWYQIFEYAIGHWLQKATEHVIGCVLCSPGCFSLFRGKALMEPNVMKKYTKESDAARHYVQYDQGEDRWLCTLLLQRGYRVEYSAASDAYTHCPESFNEFYTQRRRWVPSTMANIMDLLEDYKRTIKVNDNISLPYIFYQSLLMGGTVLGPGTIFLMLVGAFVAAFKIDNWTAFYYNLIPIIIYIVVCMFMKDNIQLVVALILSALYGLVMMAVLVGILIQINEDGVLAPSTLFLFIVAGEIIVAGLMHPQEVLCLPSGAIYYVTIPSMYLLLIIYSVCNLNVVTWGTREVKTRKSKAELEEERKEAEEMKKKAKEDSWLGFLGQLGSNMRDEEGSIEFSLSGLFRCMLCTKPKEIDERQQLLKIADSLGGVKRRLENIERLVDPNSVGISRRRTTSNTSLATREPSSVVAPGLEPTMERQELISESEDESQNPVVLRDDLQDPFWIEDPKLKNGKVEFLAKKEEIFWTEMIAKYLFPLNENKEKKAQISSDLKELRNRMVMTFFMLNALFVTIVFLMQLNKDIIFLNWPIGAKCNISYDSYNFEINVSKEYLQLEPIGIVFVVFFAIILVVQFFAMIYHRYETLCHLLSTTTLTILTPRTSPLDTSIDEKVRKAIKRVRRARQTTPGEDPRQSMVIERDVSKRKTIMELDESFNKRKTSVNLEDSLAMVFNTIKVEEDQEIQRRESNRRSSIFNRLSLMPSNKPKRSTMRPTMAYSNPAIMEEDETEEKSV